ncbi:zinc-binding dehydrogenase [Rhodococcus wratislaviensis]|uniref:zinc-binding dehydrogenase n=1 Tax=Rhodococcus wratislaviensis TaxID=44752 RepID=UPI003666123B
MTILVGEFRTYGAGDVHIDDVPDSMVKLPHRCTGSPHGVPARGSDLRMVDGLSVELTTARKGDLAVPPFSTSDNACHFDGDGPAHCVPDPTASFQDSIPDEVAPCGDPSPVERGTLVKLPAAKDSPRCLAFDTVRHLRQIILMGRHQQRTDLGKEFGATDIVAARGEEGIAAVRDLTGGDGVHVVLEAVGHMPAYEQSVGIVRPGGVISRVGVPQYDDAPVGFASLFGRNIRLAGGPAPARAYINELMPDILDGTIEPGKVFDATTGIDGVPAGYQDMDDRKSLKVYVKP